MRQEFADRYTGLARQYRATSRRRLFRRHALLAEQVRTLVRYVPLLDEMRAAQLRARAAERGDAS
jgi:hypothetical protein